MGYLFQKLIAGDIVSSNGNKAFRILSTDTVYRFDLSKLGLPSGKYEITVTASSSGWAESNHSNAVVYISN